MLGLLFATVVALAANAANQTFDLPFDDKTKGPDGFPIYVDDAAAAGAFPWIAHAGPRLDRCLSGMTIPEILTVQYSPNIVSPHVVEMNTLHCEHPRGATTQQCSAGEHVTAYFDTDASRYFTAAKEIPVNDVVALVHAIVSGEMMFAAGVNDPQLAAKHGQLGTIEKSDRGFLVRYGDCGCSGEMSVSRDANTGKYVATEAGMRMCI